MEKIPITCPRFCLIVLWRYFHVAYVILADWTFLWHECLNKVKSCLFYEPNYFFWASVSIECDFLIMICHLVKADDCSKNRDGNWIICIKIRAVANNKSLTIITLCISISLNCTVHPRFIGGSVDEILTCAI